MADSSSVFCFSYEFFVDFFKTLAIQYKQNCVVEKELIIQWFQA